MYLDVNICQQKPGPLKLLSLIRFVGDLLYALKLIAGLGGLFQEHESCEQHQENAPSLAIVGS